MHSITFLNMTGDITITWDDTNKEKIIEMIKKKMAEGYSFFTTKKVPLVEIYRKVKVTKKNIDKVEAIIITDEQFDKMVKDMNDSDVAEIVNSGNGRLAKRKDKGEPIETVKREADAKKVAESNSVAVRPIRGG